MYVGNGKSLELICEKLSKVISLRNLLYQVKLHLTFENFYQFIVLQSFYIVNGKAVKFIWKNS